MASFGYSFTPGLQQQFQRSLAGQSAQLPANASQALQILSLHLPAVLQGAPIAPDALLQPRVGGSTPDQAVRAQTTGTPASAPIGPPPSSSLSSPTDPSPLTVSPPPGNWQNGITPPSPGITAPLTPTSTPSASPFQPALPDTGPAPTPPPGGIPGFVFDQGPRHLTPAPTAPDPIADLLANLFGNGPGSTSNPSWPSPGGWRGNLGEPIDVRYF